MTVDFLATSEIGAVEFSMDGLAATKSAVMVFGRTVIIAVPCVTFECTVVEPPKTNCVAVQSGATSTASVIIPQESLMATRPATSFPKACEAISTAAGFN